MNSLFKYHSWFLFPILCMFVCYDWMKSLISPILPYPIVSCNEPAVTLGHCAAAPPPRTGVMPHMMGDMKQGVKMTQICVNPAYMDASASYDAEASMYAGLVMVLLQPHWFSFVHIWYLENKTPHWSGSLLHFGPLCPLSCWSRKYP